MKGLGARLAVPLRVAGALITVAVAGVGLAIAEGPGQSTTYAGNSAAGAVLTVTAGLGLALAGVVTAMDPSRRRTGDLAMAAGALWFMPLFVAWQEGPPLVRSIAAFLSPLAFPLILNLLLAFPTGRAPGIPARLVVAAAYVEGLLAGTLLAIFRDPYLDRGCWANCTANVFLIKPLPSLVQAIETTDRWLVAAAAMVMVGFCLARLAFGPRAVRRSSNWLLIPGIVFGLTVVGHAALVERLTAENPLNAALAANFDVQCAALATLGGGLLAAAIEVQLQRRDIARIVMNAAEAPAPGSMQSALAKALGDARLRLAYWLPDRQGFVDAYGRAVDEPKPERARSATRLTRQEATIAVVSHAGSVANLIKEIGPAMRLGLENERLQAEVLARLGELRESRARIVQTSDAERRTLERNLHDGAQQQLLALSYNLRLARSSAAAHGEAAAESALAAAIEDTQQALEELRDLAHGIYPAILMEAGLTSALESLADSAPVVVQIEGADQRFPAAVETVVYFVAVDALTDATERGATLVSIAVAHGDHRLSIIVQDDGSARTSRMVLLADRVGALGGTVALEPNICRVEMPCEPLVNAPGADDAAEARISWPTERGE
jgi:signal transduction histidine kinase